jgi:integrase
LTASFVIAISGSFAVSLTVPVNLGSPVLKPYRKVGAYHTDLACQNATPGDSKAGKMLYDGNTPLYLLVTVAGGKVRKYWQMRATVNGKRRLMSGGAYPKVSLKAARLWRENVEKGLAAGKTPADVKKDIGEAAKRQQEERRAAEIESGNTFRKVAERLWNTKTVTYGTLSRIKNGFEIHLFPALGDKNIKDIKPHEIMAVLEGIAAKKNKKGQKMSYSCHKFCTYCSEVFKFYNATCGEPIVNPCESLSKFLPSHAAENMRRIPFEELPKFIKALRTYGGTLVIRRAIWLMLYTGMRQRSLINARWGDFDLERRIWNRRAEKKDASILPLPLPSQALAMLEEMKPAGDASEKLVFHGVYDEKKEFSYNTITHAIRRMGFDMTGHGLRGLVITGLNELGFDPRLIEKQVGHKIENKVIASYNKATYFDKRRDMMQEWADYLDAVAVSQPPENNALGAVAFPERVEAANKAA